MTDQPDEQHMARLYRINDQITAMLDQDGVTDLTDEKRDDLLDTLTHFVADSFDDARAGRDVPPVIRPDYTEAVEKVKGILKEHGPSHLDPYLETWNMAGSGFRVAEVGWQSLDHTFGAAYMQSDLPGGLAVCAQVERAVLAHAGGDPEEADLEAARLVDLIRDNSGDPAAVADQNVARFTRGDGEKVAGRPLTDSEYRNLVKAAEFSSMGEAFTEVVHAVIDTDADDDTTP